MISQFLPRDTRSSNLLVLYKKLSVVINRFDIISLELFKNKLQSNGYNIGISNPICWSIKIVSIGLIPQKVLSMERNKSDTRFQIVYCYFCPGH